MPNHLLKNFIFIFITYTFLFYHNRIMQFTSSQFHLPTTPTFLLPIKSYHLQTITPPIPALRFRPIRHRFPPKLQIFCTASSDSGSHSDNPEFLQASLLVSETIAHYRMRRQGFREEMTSSFLRTRNNNDNDYYYFNMNSIERGFLRRFQSPTIFLKVSCDADFLIPIIVGDFAVEKLIAALRGDNGDCSDLYQVVNNMAERFGFRIKMARITERVVNTYYAKLYFSKPGSSEIVSVDIRPSDAINVAARCKAPIYVSKEIVFMDAIKIGTYGAGRSRGSRAIYDVSLDGASDGPDALNEELVLVKSMNLAVQEERYHDAAMLRDKLMELRKARHEL